MITTSDAARVLGCDVRTVQRMVARGDLTDHSTRPRWCRLDAYEVMDLYSARCA